MASTMSTLLLDGHEPEQELPTTVTDSSAPHKHRRLRCSRATFTTIGLGLFMASVAIAFCVIFATVSTAPVSKPVASRPMVMLVGDSITQFGGNSDGWGTQLQTAYIRSVDVINRGLSGYTTRTFLDKAMPVVSHELKTSFAPVLITLWYGANDAALADGPSSSQHVPLDEYKSNLVEILNEFQRLAPQAKILVMSPPAVDDAKRRSLQVAAGGNSDPIDRTNEQAGLYATACGGVVQSLDLGDGRLSFLDVHSYMMTAYDNSTARAALLSDGLHLSAEGNRVVFEQVKSRVQLLVPKAELETPQIPL